MKLVKYDEIIVELKDGQTGYDVVGEYVRRYWKHNAYETVVVSIATSYNGRIYKLHNDVASPSSSDFDDVEFLHDWWEGEKLIKLFAIKGISELNISGGIYEEEE